MADFEFDFNIVEPITNEQATRIERALEQMEGINHVKINYHDNKVHLGFTPGMVNVQMIKEEIEKQGVDVSDRGDD